MGHGEYCALEGKKIFFQPSARFKIQMVCRLVKQQQVRLLAQKLGQGETRFFSSAQLPRFHVGRLVGKAHAVEHAPDFELGVVTSYALIIRRQLVKLFRQARVFRAVGLCAGNFFGKRFELRGNAVDFRKAAPNFAVQSVLRLHSLDLSQISDFQPLSDVNGVGRVFVSLRFQRARNYVEKRRLSRPVDAHNTQPVLFVDGKVYFVQNGLRAEGFCEIFQLYKHLVLP